LCDHDLIGRGPGVHGKRVGQRSASHDGDVVVVAADDRNRFGHVAAHVDFVISAC
jgi:hypothetical protein